MRAEIFLTVLSATYFQYSLTDEIKALETATAGRTKENKQRWTRTVRGTMKSKEGKCQEGGVKCAM